MECVCFKDLDQIVEPLRATCTTKVKANSVKQEFEKQDELKRSAMRAVAALLQIPDAGLIFMSLVSAFLYITLSVVLIMNWFLYSTRNQKRRPILDNAYRQDIVTRICSYTRVELITKSVTYEVFGTTVWPMFTFWKISTTNFRILWRHLPTELRKV